MRLLPASVIPWSWKTAAAMASIAMLTMPAIPRAIDHVDEREAVDPAPGLRRAADQAPLGERRVQVDHVRHDGRADDAHRQQQRRGARDARHERAVGDLVHAGAREHDLDRERRHDHPHQDRDDRLQAAKPRRLQPQDPEGRHGGDQAADEQRQPEDDVDAQRRADELGQIGRHRDELGLDPQPDDHRPREVLPAQLGQVLAGRDADLGADRLDQHRHEVGDDDRPQQLVAELRAGGHVDGEVARIDVGDGGDERRSQERQVAAQPATVAAAAARPRPR